MDSLSFILNFFREGIFDGRKAYMKLAGKRRTVLMPWLVAAAASLALGIFLFTEYRNSVKEYYAYDIRQEFTLPDGTQAVLFPGSSLNLKPHRNPRAVNMSGTVRFTVAKDSAHPFTVSTQNAFAEVLGTVFTLCDNPPEITVEEGRVRFAAQADAEGIVLEKGESAIIKDGAPEKKPLFVFEDTPLREVLESLSGHFGVRLRCAEEGKRLSAEFKDERLEDIILLVEEALDVKIDVVK